MHRIAHTQARVKAGKLIPGRINASVSEKTFFQTVPSEPGAD